MKVKTVATVYFKSVPDCAEAVGEGRDRDWHDWA